jgi:hypothetical protein
LDHAAGEVAHDGFRLEMQVTEHLVATPSAEEADDVTINVSTQQSHSTSGAEGAGVDVGRQESERRSKEGGGSTEGGGDVSRGDEVSPGAVDEGSERCVGW